MLGLCSTCLSVNRNVTPLNKFRDKSILVDWFGVNLDDLKICWECNAMFSKINKFKSQVFKAQRIRSRVAFKKLNHMIPLSNLSIYIKHTYDKEYKEKHKSHSKPKKAKLKKESTNNSDNTIKEEKENEFGTTSKPNEKTKRKHKGEKRKHTASVKIHSNKKAKHEKESIDTNICSNAGIDEVSPMPRKLSPSENRFIVVHLTEEAMQKAREMDRNSPRYKSRLYKCERCIMGYYNKQYFEKHLKEKHTISLGNYMCPICETRFPKVHLVKFKLHFESHYKSYRCKLCGYQNHRLYAMETHLDKEHETETKYVCSTCNLVFDSKRMLCCHRAVAHKKLFKCDQCEKTFRTKKCLKEHTVTHIPTQIMTSTLCKRVCAGKQSYRAHCDHAHGALNECAYCADCDAHFKSEHKYKEHLDECERRALPDETRYSCNLCKDEFDNNETLQRHVASVHTAPKHSDNVCNESSTEIDRLNLLEKPEDVTGPKHRTCPCCSEGFYVGSALLNHIRTHTGEKPFQCEHCNKRFAVNFTLKKHVKRHRDDDDDLRQL